MLAAMHRAVLAAVLAGLALTGTPPSAARCRSARGRRGILRQAAAEAAPLAEGEDRSMKIGTPDPPSAGSPRPTPTGWRCADAT